MTSTDPRITRITARALTLHGDDIDTDQILPSRHLTAVTFEGMEAHVFSDLRAAARAQGRPHPLDEPRFAGSRILLVNRNFGCGSSREHAPQGLRRFGIRAIIGESFGEIFAGNCIAVGMPCVRADPDAVSQLQSLNEANPSLPLTLDLETLTIAAGNHVFPISLAEGRRRQLLEGAWDATSVLLAAGQAIEQTLAALKR